MATRHRLAAPYQAMKTADGFMVVGVNNQRLWLRFLEALGAPDPVVVAAGKDHLAEVS